MENVYFDSLHRNLMKKWNILFIYLEMKKKIADKEATRRKVG